jgi:PPOX class probable FMN-dependent enzyme
MNMFEHIVRSERELREIIGVPGARAAQKMQSTLDAHCRAFIAQSPFLLMATAGPDGRCDVSPKGDAPGFVHVMDERRLVIPDRPGNKRLDGMMNLITNPHVGLIFVVPGREETLRVNGRAWITLRP